MPDKLEILVVDDHVVVREGLKRILQEDGDCTVAAEAGSVAEALAWRRSRRTAHAFSKRPGWSATPS
jgi:DNA-binding NarL/FixJ family response regulator